MTGPYAYAAWAYRRAGWAGVLPLPPGAKWPPPGGYTGWAGVEPSGPDVQAWIDGPEGAGNVALRLPAGVYGLDVDNYGGKHGAAALALLEDACGPLPPTWVVSSRDDGVSGIRLYRAYLPIGRRWRDQPAGGGAGIEAIHLGHRYAVVWPSVHPETGRKYVWTDPGGVTLDGPVPELATLPELPAAHVEALSEPGEVRVGEMAGHAETIQAVMRWREGDPCPRVSDAAARAMRGLVGALHGASLHPVSTAGAFELCCLGWEGHVGVRRALAEHYALHVEVRRARGEDGEAEWWREVRGAIGKLPAATAREACDCGLWAGQGVTFTPDELGVVTSVTAEGGDAVASDPSGGVGGVTRLLRRSALASLPPVEPLIANMISLRSAGIIVGPTGVGKTFTTLGLACAVATGTPWLGRTTTRTPVLYVVGEGAYGLDARISAWEQEYGVPVGDDDLAFRVKPGSLIEVGTWSELFADAREIGARWVVLDTFSSLASDADETKDAAVIMRRLSDLAVALDGTASLVHHPGWSDADRVRGGYQFEANADEVLLLKRGNKRDEIVMKRKKVKEGPDGEEIPLLRKSAHGSLVIVARGDEFGDIEADRGTARVLALIDVMVSTYGDEGPGGTRDEIRNIFSGRPEVAGLKPDAMRQAFGRAWTRLAELRRIVKVGAHEKFRFLSVTNLTALDHFEGEPPLGLSVWDKDVNAWVEM